MSTTRYANWQNEMTHIHPLYDVNLMICNLEIGRIQIRPIDDVNFKICNLANKMTQISLYKISILNL